MSMILSDYMRLPVAVLEKEISNGSKILYGLLFETYRNFEFSTFIPSDYKKIMRVSCRQLYRYFYELIAYGCIYQYNGIYYFRFL